MRHSPSTICETTLSSQADMGLTRLRYSRDGFTLTPRAPLDYPLTAVHRAEVSANTSYLTNPRSFQPSPASSLPSEILQCILDHAPNPCARQAARLTHSLVSRHWYSASRYPTHYAVTNSQQARKLATNLALTSESTVPVRRLYIRVAQRTGIDVDDMKAFSDLLDACPQLDTLELNLGAEWDPRLTLQDNLRGPDSKDTFARLDDSIRRQSQLRVLVIAKHNWIIPCVHLFHVLRPLQNLEILDLTESEVEDTHWGEAFKPTSVDTPSLQLPLQTLMLKSLDDPAYWPAVAEIMPFARQTLRRLRVGKLRDAVAPDTLSALFASIQSIASKILEFDCRIYQYEDDEFVSKPFLDLNHLLLKMSSVESLEINLSGRVETDLVSESGTRADMTRKVDRAIVETLKAAKNLKHLVLHVRGDPPTPELEGWAKTMSTLQSLTLAIGRPELERKDHDLRPEWVTDLSNRIEAALPASTTFSTRFYTLD